MPQTIRSRARTGAAALGLAACALLGASTAAAPARSGSPPPEELEVAVARAELRWSRTGRLLGHLHRGSTVERLGGRDGWTRVGVRGWMWSASLERTGGRYRVTPPEENLRAAPMGSILGTLARGVQVDRVGGEGKWYEIELIGWLPDSAVRGTAPDLESEAAAESGAPDASARDSLRNADKIAPDPAEEAGEVQPAASPRSASRSAAPAARLEREAPLRSVPAGPVLTTLPEEVVLTPLETRGGWTRVAVEGWVPSSAVRAGDAESSPAAVAMDPEAFAGRRVVWTLEHVALQQADRWRTDLEPGEWYALARVPGGEGRYVYLALPEGLVDEFRRLAPFRTIRVEGRVRAGRSALTGSPVMAVARLLP